MGHSLEGRSWTGEDLLPGPTGLTEPQGGELFPLPFFAFLL